MVFVGHKLPRNAAARPLRQVLAPCRHAAASGAGCHPTTLQVRGQPRCRTPMRQRARCRRAFRQACTRVCGCVCVSVFILRERGWLWWWSEWFAWVCMSMHGRRRAHLSGQVHERGTGKRICSSASCVLHPAMVYRAHSQKSPVWKTRVLQAGGSSAGLRDRIARRSAKATAA